MTDLKNYKTIEVKTRNNFDITNPTLNGEMAWSNYGTQYETVA